MFDSYDKETLTILTPAEIRLQMEELSAKSKDLDLKSELIRTKTQELRLLHQELMMHKEALDRRSEEIRTKEAEVQKRHDEYKQKELESKKELLNTSEELKKQEEQLKNAEAEVQLQREMLDKKISEIQKRERELNLLTSESRIHATSDSLLEQFIGSDEGEQQNGLTKEDAEYLERMDGQRKNLFKRILNLYKKRDGQSKTKALATVAFTFAGLFAISFFAVNVMMTALVGTGKEVVVPDLQDLHFDVARKRLMEMDLFAKQVEMQHHDEIAKNRIISQSPLPNAKTKKNRTIEVVVSLGPELIRVPYLDNITQREARLRLDNVGLKLGEVLYRYSDVVDKDRIINSQPIADDFISKGSKVNIYISLGKLPDAQDRHQRYRGVLDGLD